MKKGKIITIRVTPGMLEFLQLLAKKDGRTVSDTLRRLVKEHQECLKII